MAPQAAYAKARSICQRHGLDAEVFELPGPGGEVVIVIIDPSRPDKSVISYAEEILRAVQIELENELPGCRIERSIV
jgi:hypothetical protein